MIVSRGLGRDVDDTPILVTSGLGANPAEAQEERSAGSSKKNRLTLTRRHRRLPFPLSSTGDALQQVARAEIASVVAPHEPERSTADATAQVAIPWTFYAWNSAQITMPVVGWYLPPDSVVNQQTLEDEAFAMILAMCV